MALPLLKSSPMRESFPASKSTPEQGHGRSSRRENHRRPGRIARPPQGIFSHGRPFAKWRAVIAVGDGIPSRGCIEANAQALARYAALCQEAGLVPVVEPEVLMDGEHTLERCREVTEEVLRTVFNQLYTQRVTLEGMILKPNMVLPGLTCPKKEDGGRGGRRHGEMSLASGSRCRSGDCVPVGRPIRRTGLGPLECHECPIQVATALGAGVFVCPCDPAAGFGDLARQGGQRAGGTASSVSSSQMQPGRAPWRIQPRDGKGMCMILWISKAGPLADLPPRADTWRSEASGKRTPSRPAFDMTVLNARAALVSMQRCGG